MLCSIEFGRRLRTKIAAMPNPLARTANNKKAMFD